LTFPMILLISSFALVTCSAIATIIIVWAMVRKINGQRGKEAPLRYLGSSWATVSREYKLLQPQGKLPRAMVITLSLTGAFFVLAIVLVFTVLPRYTFPLK
jgi:RsiW-degrading membrane proteinase PrsW (M82 family)